MASKTISQFIQRWKDKGLNPEDISNDEIFGDVAGKNIQNLSK